MTGSFRVWAAALLAALFITRAEAADLTPTPEPPPPPAPLFFVHVGALGVFPQTNAQSTGGGFFNFLPVPAGALSATSAQGAISNVAIRPIYTVGLEAGYFVTPNIAIALSAGVPPIAHLKATGLTLARRCGTDLLGSVRFGPAMLLAQYHFTNFGAFQPYLGVGAVYVLNFGNFSDGILQISASIRILASSLQAGADYMLTQNWGVFIDAKKIFYSTNCLGLSPELGCPDSHPCSA